MSASIRAINAQETYRLINAATILLGTDFSSKMMGSSVIISLTDLEGNKITDDFSVNAEDLEQIKPAIIESLKTTLDHRLRRLQTEIKDIESLLASGICKS